MDRFWRLLSGMRVRPGSVALILGALALIGVGGYVASRYIWAEYQWRSAGQALERHDLVQAQAGLQRYLEVWPNSAEGHFLIAQTARRAGDFAGAKIHLDVCQRLGWVPEAIELERALALAQRGELADVEGYLISCASQDYPDKVLILEALAQGYIKTYQLPKASNYLDQWLEHQPANLRALLWRAEVNERLRRHEEAQKDYERVVELDPQCDAARQHLAELLIRRNRFPEALEHLERLRLRRPKDPALLVSLARCRRLMGEPEEARQLLDAALAEHPQRAPALGERGRVAMGEEKLVEAEGWLRRAVAAAPYDQELVYTLYTCLEHQGKKDEARKWHERLKELEADLRRMEEVTKRIPQSPRDPDLRSEAGRIMLRNGYDREGLRWLESALGLDPWHLPTHTALADYYDRQGDHPRAAWHRKAAAGRVPGATRGSAPDPRPPGDP